MISSTKLSLSLVCMLCLTGCASPIEKDSIASYVSKDANIDSNSIHYYSNCSRMLVPKTSTNGTWKPCALALTDEELFVYATGTDKVSKGGHLGEADNEVTELTLDLRLPFSEMKGIEHVKSGRSHQIQISTDTEILVLQITGQNRLFLDAELTRNIHDFLLEKGVPKLEGGKSIAATESTDAGSNRGDIIFLMPLGLILLFPMILAPFIL